MRWFANVANHSALLKEHKAHHKPRWTQQRGEESYRTYKGATTAVGGAGATEDDSSNAAK